MKTEPKSFALNQIKPTEIHRKKTHSFKTLDDKCLRRPKTEQKFTQPGHKKWNFKRAETDTTETDTKTKILVFYSLSSLGII